MPKSVQFVAGALAVAWLTGPANGERMPWSHDAVDSGTDSAKDGQFLKRSLGLGIGKPEFDANADLNGDGVVNVLDVAIFRNARRSVHTANGAAAYTRRSANDSATHAVAEEIVVEPLTTPTLPGRSGSFRLLIQNNTTPLLGYSLAVQIVPEPNALGSITVDVASSNFVDSRNLIAGGCATLDPIFSVIQDGGDGGIFINAITDDNSTCVAIDGVNDVLQKWSSTYRRIAHAMPLDVMSSGPTPEKVRVPGACETRLPRPTFLCAARFSVYHCGIRAPPMLLKAISEGAVAGTTGAAFRTSDTQCDDGDIRRFEWNPRRIGVSD